ncbi:YlzJ-like family protein [Virgibacillus alimentarius]|uniref:Competence transcription factor ComK n=1 Tax=Virgibacillus alimentarius TaxID=698769 RepID=A0ABS4S438_9BACI|nr:MULTISPECIES: YlzJ-like family protein [Virgibacillus]MBP2256248.1 competence transcription factor ComK [Virgibacillus alimentarius]HLR66195.1 YlzJ-like family protein [Virgibacillus sp.]
MILYTPLSQTDIFPDSNDSFNNRQWVSYHGMELYVEKRKDGSYQLLQLLSTDPQDFLNSNFTPGTILS